MGAGDLLGGSGAGRAGVLVLRCTRRGLDRLAAATSGTVPQLTN
jgi:hypothetical protein